MVIPFADYIVSRKCHSGLPVHAEYTPGRHPYDPASCLLCFGILNLIDLIGALLDGDVIPGSQYPNQPGLCSFQDLFDFPMSVDPLLRRVAYRPLHEMVQSNTPPFEG